MNETDKTPEQDPIRRGAGILVLARDTGRFLALKRSDHVHNGRTWALAGGLLDEGETPEEGAVREFCEETGYNGQEVALVPLVQYTSPNFTYNNYIAIIEQEFKPIIDHENEAFAWVESLEDWPAPAHFGIPYLKQDTASVDIIRATQAECLHDGTAAARARSLYPPTLYHFVPGAGALEELAPDAKRGEIRATPNLRKTLPLLIRRRYRVATAPLPGTEDFIIIASDRDELLEKGLDGSIFQLSGEDFSPRVKDGKPSATWFTTEKLPIESRNFFDHVQQLDAAMFYGLHVLFVNEKLTDDRRAFFKAGMAAADFPANLKAMVRDGTLTYENAKRGIHISPQLQPEDGEPPPPPPNPRKIIKFKKR
ncbi:MAG: NUDIX hydrolase [Micavibrio sp.]|nr:NUDIX hydrolase [Micavibrio sp.]